MKITECQDLLTRTLSSTQISAPEGTHFNRIAAQILEMARAYESDGIGFFQRGDPVNALASYYYGFGWLHFGLSSGLLNNSFPVTCPFLGPAEVLHSRHRPKLEEKTTRYARLLDIARTSVKCSMDEATKSYVFARRILCISFTYARRGEDLVNAGDPEGALASFSYGHGWLDAAVTAGFFCIVAEQDLFTV
jgi:uncharacterized protein